MKKRFWMAFPIKVITAVAIAQSVTGCASNREGRGGTASLNIAAPIQGRDLGRGGATSGGNSSLDPSGNAADWSVYDAREEAQR